MCIVKFLDDENSVAVVPNKWILEDGWCVWPPYEINPQKILRAVKQGQIPTKPDDWKRCKIEVVHHYEIIIHENLQNSDRWKKSAYSESEADASNRCLRKRGSVTTAEGLKCGKMALLNYTSPPTSLDGSKRCQTVMQKPMPASSESASASIAGDQNVEAPYVVESNRDSVTYLFPQPIEKSQSGFQREVIIVLSDIKLRLSRLESAVATKKLTHSATDWDDEEFALLPARCDEDLQEIFGKVQRDKHFKKKLVARFGSIGGRKPSLHVNSILSDLLTDELAVEAVKEYKKTPSVITKDEVNSFIQTWLRHAKDRIQAKAKSDNLTSHCQDENDSNNIDGADSEDLF
ncbi:unnamed protein product [Allacma fusca]|uniref:DUF4806 domain-containing protein n=1 Tax=Allacma fusca TaxID=39272 RepID=A0A8J2LLM7_9HEXA|nr:unnamed protein product [Allacma fusca]